MHVNKIDALVEELLSVRFISVELSIIDYGLLEKKKKMRKDKLSKFEVIRKKINWENEEHYTKMTKQEWAC